MTAKAEAGSAAGAAPLSARGLRQRVLSLGSAKAFDYAVQFLLPVVLVRCLDAETFGEYRLLWVAVGTVLAVAPLGLPGCLFYFLPRLSGAARRLYINQTLIFLSTTGLIGALAVSPWNPWLPETMKGLMGFGPLVPAFVVLWVVASFLDVLPTIEEHILWQAKATVGLGILRAAALSAAAYFTGELGAVLAVLLAFVVLKLGLLVGYIAAHHGLGGPYVRRSAFADQIAHAAPFGAAGGLHDLRSQSDQWVAAALFPLGMFASFSVAAVLAPLVNLFRQSVSSVFLPGMSRMQGEGDVAGMLEQNSRANVMVGAMVLPLLAFAFLYAEQIITVVYTATYVEAAPVMRIYIAGLAALIVELASVVLLLRQGPFMLRLNLILLVLSVAASYIGAREFGLPGAAAGFLVAAYLNPIITLRRISLITGMPLRRLQDWGALAQLALFTLIAAAAASLVDSRFLASSAPFLRMAGGGAVLGAAYVLMHLFFGEGRALRKRMLEKR